MSGRLYRLHRYVVTLYHKISSPEHFHCMTFIMIPTSCDKNSVLALKQRSFFGQKVTDLKEVIFVIQTGYMRD